MLVATRSDLSDCRARVVTHPAQSVAFDADTRVMSAAMGQPAIMASLAMSVMLSSRHVVRMTWNFVTLNGNHND